MDPPGDLPGFLHAGGVWDSCVEASELQTSRTVLVEGFAVVIPVWICFAGSRNSQVQEHQEYPVEGGPSPECSALW